MKTLVMLLSLTMAGAALASVEDTGSDVQAGEAGQLEEAERQLCDMYAEIAYHTALAKANGVPNVQIFADAILKVLTSLPADVIDHAFAATAVNTAHIVLISNWTPAFSNDAIRAQCVGFWYRKRLKAQTDGGE